MSLNAIHENKILAKIFEFTDLIVNELGDNCIQIIIWEGISLDIRSEI